MIASTDAKTLNKLQDVVGVEQYDFALISDLPQIQIATAIGILMARCAINKEQAHRALIKRTRGAGRSTLEMAREIVESVSAYADARDRADRALGS